MYINIYIYTLTSNPPRPLASRCVEGGLLSKGTPNPRSLGRGLPLPYPHARKLPLSFGDWLCNKSLWNALWHGRAFCTLAWLFSVFGIAVRCENTKVRGKLN